MTDQRTRALHKANYVRLSRAQLKSDIKAGRVRVPELLRGDYPDWLEKMKVGEVVLAIPSIRRNFLLNVLAEASPTINYPLLENREMQLVTKRQRDLISNRVEAWETKKGRRTGKVAA